MHQSLTPEGVPSASRCVAKGRDKALFCDELGMRTASTFNYSNINGLGSVETILSPCNVSESVTKNHLQYRATHSYDGGGFLMKNNKNGPS